MIARKQSKAWVIYFTKIYKSADNVALPCDVITDFFHDCPGVGIPIVNDISFLLYSIQ